MTPSYVIYNPSNSIVFDSPHLDHLTHGILPPFKSYNDEKKISIKRYKIIDKDEVLDGHVEYQYENGNLVRCFIHETSELLQYNNFKYEITDGLVTCEKSFYNSELSRETYFEYNNMMDHIIDTMRFIII